MPQYRLPAPFCLSLAQGKRVHGTVPYGGGAKNEDMWADKVTWVLDSSFLPFPLPSLLLFSFLPLPSLLQLLIPFSSHLASKRVLSLASGLPPPWASRLLRIKLISH